MTPPPLQITCKELVELLTAHLDGALAVHGRTRFDQHLGHCPGCRAYAQQFDLTVSAQSAMPRGEIEPDNLDHLLTVLSPIEAR
jgi:predicted anti-sigma-YlaC factor YlaD